MEARFLDKDKQILASKKGNSSKEEQDSDALFTKIGQLQVEIDFLKKLS